MRRRKADAAAGRVFSYSAYGLAIGSSLPLPELVPGSGPFDVRIRLGTLGGAPDDRCEPARDQVVAHWSDGTIRLRWPDTGTFLIKDGREIILEPIAGVDPRWLRLFILGPALATLLRQRGHLVLHGSTVAIRDQALTFLGGSGWGKSTIAAACHRLGHQLIADDLAAVDLADGGPRVLPGYPGLRLWPEGSAGDGPPHIYPGTMKRLSAVGRGFARSAVPLKRIYVLNDGRTTSLEGGDQGVLEPSCDLGRAGVPPSGGLGGEPPDQEMDRHEALAELLRHSYGARSLWSVRPEGHFAQCAALAARVAVRRLRRRRALEELPELVRRVEEDLARDAG